MVLYLNMDPSSWLVMSKQHEEGNVKFKYNETKTL